MKRINYILSIICMGLLSCAEHDGLTNGDYRQLPVNIGGSYPVPKATTRAAIDGGFVSNDAMGVFVVDRNEDGDAGEVLLSGNRASNLKVTLQDDGSWKAAAQLFWDANGKSADFYGYYPFTEQLSSVKNLPYTISDRQDFDDNSTSSSGYAVSDLLWAHTPNVAPTTETIVLQYHHVMAGVAIRLEKGTGFTEAEWNDFEKIVLIQNTILSGEVDLTTGVATALADRNTKSIRPLLHQGEWRAVTLPQTVAASKALITITVDGQNYTLKKGEPMTYHPGKMHLFTITVDRKSPSGQFEFTFTDEAIIPWMDDTALHEGLVREYVVVEVSQPGRLAEDLERMGKDSSKIEALKVVGTINQADMDFLGTMEHLTDLNMQKCIVEGGKLNGLRGSMENRMQIRHFVFPEKGLKTIGGYFLEWSHLSGSLIIPEGVERIEEGAFKDCKDLTGSLSLPSTLKYIGPDVLAYSNIHSELRLPEGLEEYHGLGGNYTGTYYVPSSLKVMGTGLPTTLTGTLYFPQGLDYSHFGALLDGCQCTSAIFPEGMTNIPRLANSELRGEIKLPSTVTRLGGMTFMNTKITKVIFSENLRELDDSGYLPEEGIFARSNLTGTIELPKKVGRIPRGCFMGCTMLTGVVIPEGVLIIDDLAFAECVNLNSIVCKGEEPPLVTDNAFLGVPKDNFTVEVPKGCVQKYRNARGWSDFKRIAEHSDFVCRPAQVQALNQLHQETLVLNAEGAWTVTHKPDWCSLNKMEGTGKTELMVTFARMEHGAGNRADSIVFSMAGKGDHTTYCVLRQYDYEQEEDGCLTLQQHTKGNGIDIVFAGDGWDGQTISDGSYLDLVKYQTECFFAVEPYRSMRDYFNVYVTFPLSQERGVNTMYTYVNNRFGTLYGMNELPGVNDSNTSSELITESDEVMDYVVDKTPVAYENLWRSLVILVPNTTDYDGHTELMANGGALCICPPSDKPYPCDTRGVIQHEAGGHGFGKLGDEEIVRNAFATSNIKQKVNEMHRRGWYQNLSTTGKLSQVPWADFIFDTRYSDYVDVYEGGFGYTRGIYRPEANSCMNYGIPYYNTPSRLDIWKRIKEYAGESWTMQEFYAQDTFEWGPTNVTRSLAMPDAGQGYAMNAHHVAPQMVDFKKKGNQVRAIRNKLRVKNEK